MTSRHQQARERAEALLGEPQYARWDATKSVHEVASELLWLLDENQRMRDALSSCIPWVATSGRGSAQEALAVACQLVDTDPFGWTTHPAVLIRRMELLGMPDRRTAANSRNTEGPQPTETESCDE